MTLPHLDPLAAVFAVFAVCLIASMVAENRIWRWYVRVCRGPVPKSTKRAGQGARR